MPLAYEQRCSFRKNATDDLDAKNILWDLAFVAASCKVCIPYISAGLAVAPVLQGTQPEDWQEFPASADLPKLYKFIIYLFITDRLDSLLAQHLASNALVVFGY
ncbi:hypothetical protein OAQ37_06930 [Alphaproteobacteria bacterium]|nr:hypothetical protein [Alphaproteobacteria bacterium]